MNHFVWADLSSYSPQESKVFYQEIFGWQFHDDDGYSVAMQGSDEIIGLYETPEFFKKIEMPHFWMSYIAVEDVKKTAEVARQFDNVKVELETEFYGGRIALIRDPQGAGFTVNDGGKLNHRREKTGHLIWNELHVSDVVNIIPFYERLFGWSIKPCTRTNYFNVFNSDQQHLSDILLIPTEIKGKYEYWVCTFGVEDVAAAKQKAVRLGGGVVYEEGERTLLYDHSGEAFFYIQSLN